MSTHRTALITGAARRIGAQLAEHLAARGYHLVLHYHHSAEEAQALAAHLRATYAIDVTLAQADLTDTATLPSFWNGLPPCDVFIHNASQFARDTLADFSPQQLRAHLAIHLEAPLILAQGFMAQLPQAVGGNIIIIGDGTDGWSSSPHFFSYAISKHSWDATIDLLAAACAPRVRANVVALGATLVGSIDGADTFARLAARAPLKRTGTPEEVCQAIDFLLAAPGVTGQILSLANGFGLASARPI